MDAKGLKLGVLASGRGSDLQSLLDAHADRKIASHVVVVVSDQPGAEAVARARRAGVPGETVPVDTNLRGDARRKAHEDRIAKILTHFEADLVVLAGYMRLVSREFVRRFPHRIVNIHPALLPSFPGIHGQRQALEWGARVAGCTTHFVDEQTDHGPILLQAAVPVRYDDNEATLSERILAVEHQILPRTIHLLEQGRVRVEGRRVHLDPDASWTTKYPVLPGVLYGPGY